MGDGFHPFHQGLPHAEGGGGVITGPGPMGGVGLPGAGSELLPVLITGPGPIRMGGWAFKLIAPNVRTNIPNILPDFLYK